MSIPTATARKSLSRHKGLSLRDLHPVKIDDIASIARMHGLHNVADALSHQADVQYNSLRDFSDDYDR